jgi:glycosyltransferase involved in cell wall biosynthesis
MGHPLVSVVIPCFNQSRWIGDAIRSVARSQYPACETIVVNDGSTDDFHGSVAKHPHVKVLDQANSGVSIARNAGFAAARGDYIVFLDADDLLSPGWLSEAVDCLERDRASAFVYGHVQIIDADGNALDSPAQEAVLERHYEALLYANYVWTPGCVLYRRSALAAEGPFSTAHAGAADLEINLRLLRRFSARGLNRVATDYRVHGANMSGNPVNMFLDCMAVLQAERQHLRGRPDLRRVLRHHIGLVRSDYGRGAVDRVFTSARNGEYRRALRDLVAILRCYPTAPIGWVAGKLRRAIA